MSRVALPSAAIGLPWLIRLRWVALVGQLATFAAAATWFGAGVNWSVVASVVGCSALSNLWLVRWSRQRPDPTSLSGTVPADSSGAHRQTFSAWNRVTGGVLCFDTLLLTALLAVSGASANPFTILYTVHIVLAALLLDRSWTTGIALLSACCFATLFAFPASCHESAEGYNAHLRGMWWAFSVAAGTVAYFVREISGTIETQRHQISELLSRARDASHLAALTTLAAGAAHELRTPLATIAVASHELKQRAAGPKDMADLVLIEGEIERCQTILWNMGPKFSALEASPVAVCATSVLHEIASELRAQPDGDLASAYRIEVTAAEPKLHVACIKAELRSALVALVQNALDAVREAGSQITLAARLDEDWVCFFVEDDGPGMPEAVAERACDPFFTTKDPGKGLGLGLFLARTYAQRVGGSLLLSSGRGGGTRAELRLPALQG